MTFPAFHVTISHDVFSVILSSLSFERSPTPQTGSCLLGDHALTLPYSIPQKRRDQSINPRERESHFENREHWRFFDMTFDIRH